MKDYFSHDYNSRNDKKLVKAGMKFELCQSIGAYWCIVEMLYEEGGYLLLNEYERITFELRCSKELITYLIHDSELFKNDGVKFWSETAIERLKLRANKSTKARESIEKRWNKINNTNVLQTNNERNTSKVKESKVKVKEKETISFDFIFDAQMKQHFQTWIEYRKEIKKPLKTQMSIEACYKNLVTLSNNNYSIAKSIVLKSIANQWQGLFALNETEKQEAKKTLNNPAQYVDYNSLLKPEYRK